MMDGIKKYAAYAVIIIVLVGTALFVHAIRKTGEAGRDGERARGSYPAPQPGPPGEIFVTPSASGPMDSARLAWMLREKITLDVMERMVTGGVELNVYNERARKYNELAAAIEYKESDMAAAKRAVENIKSETVRDAMMETIALSMPPGVSGDPKANAVWRVQKYLSMLGYYPGRVDGVSNEGIVSAVNMFEVMSDVPVTGFIDEKLAETLGELWITRNTPAFVGLGY